MQTDTWIAGGTKTARWEVQAMGGSAVVRLSGEIDLAAVSSPDQGLYGEISDAVRDATVITCDLSRVAFIDSSGVHLLVKLRETANADGKTFLVAQPSEGVRRVFDIVSAEDLFEIID